VIGCKKIKLLFETTVYPISLLDYLKKTSGGGEPRNRFLGKTWRMLENVIDCFCKIA
jgi:hypothetical protein